MITANIKKRVYTSVALLLLVFLILKFNFFLVFFLIIFGILSLIEFYGIIKKILKNKLYLTLINFFFTTYIFTFTFLFFFFSNFLQFKILLFSLLFACIGSDIGGFIIGKKIKGPKLTKISPNKTISGAVGSLFFSSIIFSISIFYYTNHFSFTVVIISLITSLSCQLGDIFFSLLKRKAKIEDTGNFLPGHGGVLDRLDGIFLGIPVGFMSSILLY
jgi:phosphatidate cytidylyltransferase